MLARFQKSCPGCDFPQQWIAYRSIIYNPPPPITLGNWADIQTGEVRLPERTPRYRSTNYCRSSPGPFPDIFDECHACSTCRKSPVFAPELSDGFSHETSAKPRPAACYLPRNSKYHHSTKLLLRCLSNTMQFLLSLLCSTLIMGASPNARFAGKSAGPDPVDLESSPDLPDSRVPENQCISSLYHDDAKQNMCSESTFSNNLN